jgi:hypothetical protein
MRQAKRSRPGFSLAPSDGTLVFLFGKMLRFEAAGLPPDTVREGSA